jgi:probable phosphoglycerate mutase
VNAVNDTRFVLIRHGESMWNAAGRWQGQGDPPLSPRGREQAARLAAQLAAEGIDVIVTSDLSRAQETAAILADTLGLRSVPESRLRELDIGAWTGLCRREIEAGDRAALLHFESGAPTSRAGGGESRQEVAARVRPAVAEIAARYAGRCIAVVCHLGVVRALLPGTELDNATCCRVTAQQLAAAAAGAAP